MPNVCDVDVFSRSLNIRWNRPSLVIHSDIPCMSWLACETSGKRPQDCIYCFDRSDRPNTWCDVTYTVTAWKLGMSNTGDSVPMWNYFIDLWIFNFSMYLIKFGIHHCINSFRYFRKIAKCLSICPLKTTCLPLDRFS
jgi:hypothetical protein